MAMGTNKVKTAMNPVVHYVSAIESWFILQVCLILLINIICYSLPANMEKEHFNVAYSWTELY